MVRRLRVSLGISQVDLAAGTGLGNQTLSRIERGVVPALRASTAAKLLNYFESSGKLTAADRSRFKAVSGLSDLDELDREVITPAFQETARLRDALTTALELDDPDIHLVLRVIERLKADATPELRTRITAAFSATNDLSDLLPPSIPGAMVLTTEVRQPDGSAYRVREVTPTNAPKPTKPPTTGNAHKPNRRA